MPVITTEQLVIEELRETDAAMTLALLNDPDFISNIGDRKVRTLEQAQQYLRDGPLASYRDHGFGMYVLRLRDSGEPVGMCGLVKRPSLTEVDLGYALLPGFRGRGLAREAASAVLDFARETLGLDRLAGIVSPDNGASRHLLESLGLRQEGMVTMEGDDTAICYYTVDLQGA